jgi:AAA family ATP:ADP antiporter
MSQWRERSYFVASAIFFLAAAFVLAKTGRDALFVQDRGLFDLPKAYIGIAALSGPLAFAVLFLLKAYGARTVRLLLPVAAALSLVAFSAVVRPGGGALMTFFFMFVPLIWGVIFSASWLLASDLLDGAGRDDTARGFSLIGGAAILGGVVAGGAARLVASHFEPRAFLWFAALGLVLGAGIMAVAQRRYPPEMMPPEPGGGEGESSPGGPSLLASPYTRALAAVGMAGALVGVLVEFQFYLAASVTEGAGRDKAGFFATFYLVLNLAALVVQVFVLPRILNRVGVGGALLVVPFALVGGAAGLAASASLLVASAVRVTEGGLKSSIHRASWEQAYLGVRRTQRARTKVMVDGMATRFAEGLAALGLLLWLHLVVGEAGLKGTSTLLISTALLLAALAWLVSTRSLARAIRASDSKLDPQAPVLAPPPGG